MNWHIDPEALKRKRPSVAFTRYDRAEAGGSTGGDDSGADYSRGVDQDTATREDAAREESTTARNVQKLNPDGHCIAAPGGSATSVPTNCISEWQDLGSSPAIRDVTRKSEKG